MAVEKNARNAVLSFIGDCFDPANSEHAKNTDEYTLEPQQPCSYEFEELFDAVIDWELCSHPESEDWFCLPLHEENAPIITDEYVVFTNHQLRGRFVLLATGNSDAGPIKFKPDDFSSLAIARRLRFWAPHYYDEGFEQSLDFIECFPLDQGEQDPSEEDSDTLRTAHQVLNYALAINSSLQKSDPDELKKKETKIEERLQKSLIAEKVQVAERLWQKGKQEETSAEEAVSCGNYSRAIAKIESAIQIFGDAHQEAPDGSELESDILSDKERLDERLEQVESTQYREEVELIIEKTERWVLQGDNLCEQSAYDEASEKYETAIAHAENAVETGKKGDVLTEQTQSLRDEATNKLDTAQKERTKQRVGELTQRAAELQTDAEQSTEGPESAIESLAEARELLKSALELVEDDDTIDETDLEERLTEVRSRHTELIRSQNDERFQSRITPVDELVQDGEDLLESGDPVKAFQKFDTAVTEYGKIRDWVNEQGLGRYDKKIKGRVYKVNNRLEDTRRTCEDSIDEFLNAAESSIADAESNEQNDKYEQAQELLRNALEKFQEAHHIASVIDTESIQQVEEKFRQTEAQITSLQTVPAKLAIQECIKGARERLRAGYAAMEEDRLVSAETAFNSSIYFINEALDILLEYNFGTTEEIKRHNRSILIENKNVIERCKNAIAGGSMADLPETVRIENVSAHIRPPNGEETIDTEAELNKESFEIQSGSTETVSTEGVEILEQIADEFEDLK